MLISIKYLSLLITRENVNTMLISLNRLLPLSKSANCMRLFQYWEGWIIFQLHKAGGNCNGIVLSAGGNCNVNVHLLYPYCGLRIIKAITCRKRHLQISQQLFPYISYMYIRHFIRNDTQRIRISFHIRQQLQIIDKFRLSFSVCGILLKTKIIT